MKPQDQRREDADAAAGMLAALVESSDDAIYGKTLDGVITHWNPAAERLYGYSADEIIGQSIERLVPPERAAELAAIMQQLRSGQRVKTVDTVRCHKSGTRIHVSITVSPIYDRRGALIGASASARDISEQLQTQEALRELEQRFLQLAENLVNVFYITDALTREVRYVSSAYERIWGRSCESLYTAPESFLDSVHADDRQRVEESLQRQRRGETTSAEYRVFQPDGTLRWVWDRAFPMRDAKGRVIRIAGIVEDVTERKRIEQDLRFLAEASRSLASLVDYEHTLERIAGLAVPLFADWCAIHIAAANGELRQLAVTHVEPSKVELAAEMGRRYPPDPDVPAGAMHVFRTGEPELVSQISDALLEKVARDREQLAILRELGLRSYMCVPLSVRNKIIGVITFIAAESGRRYTEADLAVAVDLAHRAGVAIANAELYAELQAEGKRKDEFLAMLAHELRNPLAPIRSGLDVLRISGQPADVLETMQQQTEHLVRLVDDLLDISRIMRNKIELRVEPVKLATVLRRAVEAVQTLIDAQGHQLRINMPPAPVWISADPVRLAQVLTNLLHNAAKYTDRGGKLWVDVAVEDGQVLIEVGDTGIGMDRHLLPYVFEPFAQADRSLERSQGGLGIGLTLVKSLIEMHGGTVVAMSEGEGKGSRFFIRLPALVREPAPVRRPPVAVPVERRRILVVDDNVDAAKMLAMLLGVMGKHEIHLAHDGPSALVAARECQPELVLLDIGLPGMNGYELAGKMREDPRLADVLLVAVTGYGTEEDQQRSREAGFDLHMVKPLPAEAFRKILAHPKLTT